MNEKVSAVVVFFNKGWGFAELESNRDILYVHYKEILGRKSLRVGDKILCCVEPSGHPKNPWKATQIELVGLAPIAPISGKGVQS